jgi:cation diffusion facilitator family transporter
MYICISKLLWMNQKVKTARLSIISNSVLIVMKLAVGMISGSVSIISEAIHSGMDLVAAIIAFFSVKVSDTPADERHPYGHGKFENVSGVIEAVLIFIAAGWIIYEAVKKIFGTIEIDSIGLGSLVMLIAATVNWFVSKRLYKVAKETESIALEADALHLKTDVYTSLGVAFGLGLIWLTGWQILDPIVAICVAFLILKESYSLLKNAYAPLLDTALSDDEIAIIKEVLNLYSLRYHNLKTRKSGHYRFADLHLEMKPETELQKVHQLCDEIENEVQKRIKNIEITIHVEPVEG